MKQVLEVLPRSTRFVTINWVMGNLCNYKCSYCHPHNWNGTNALSEKKNHYLTNLEKIFSAYREIGIHSFQMLLSGGEPTLWSPLPKLLEELKSKFKLDWMAINTNLTKPLDWWESNYHYFDDIIASFHPETVKLDVFIEKLQFLQDHCNIAVRLMMKEDSWDFCIESAERIKNSLTNFSLEYVPLMKSLHWESGSYDYKDANKLKFFMEQNIRYEKRVKYFGANRYFNKVYFSDGTTQEYIDATDIMAKKQNFFKGYVCNTFETVFIHSDGKITTSSCGVGRDIGNLNDESGSFTFDLKPVICPRELCHCGTDISVTKRHPSLIKKSPQ